MSRRLVHNILFAVVLLAGGVGAWGWWYMAAGRFPLAGDLSHDFGPVPIVGASADVTHVFALRNRTGDTVVIDSIIPGCGCTAATASAMDAAPGEGIDVEVVFSLTHAGHKRTYVSLMVADFGEQRLWLEGVGRKETALSAASDMLRLTAGMATPLLIKAAVQSSDDPPPPPTIETPDGVSATFVEWTMVRAREAKTGKPAQWRGRIDVALTGTSVPEDSVIRATIPGAPPVDVRLAVHGGAPPPPGS
jgi:hypothetical protein